MSSESRIRTVLLTLEYSTRSSYYLDWAEAFSCSPLFEVATFNVFIGAQRRAARRAIEGAELVVALHACSADTLEYVKPLSGALQRRRGRFLAFVGNEYNLPWARLADKREFLRETAPDWIGTQLPLEAGNWLYALRGRIPSREGHASCGPRMRPTASPSAARSAGCRAPSRRMTSACSKVANTGLTTDGLIRPAARQCTISTSPRLGAARSGAGWWRPSAQCPAGKGCKRGC